MMKKNVLVALAILFASTMALFTACTKEDVTTNDATVSAEVQQYTDGAIYSIQSRSGTGDMGCFELVFPVTINFPDKTTKSVASVDELKTAIQEWRAANASSADTTKNHKGRKPGKFGFLLGNDKIPSLALPVSVIKADGTTATVATEAEALKLAAECGFDKLKKGCDGRSKGKLACFELVFPVSIALPDGTTKAAADKAALRTILHDWKKANPTATTRPSLVFPLSVTMKADGSVKTVNTKEELTALKESCKG